MQWQDVECTFRVSGKAPELWDPTTGEMRRLGVYRSVEAGTTVPLRLAPAGSVFVVFREKAPKNHFVSITMDDEREPATWRGRLALDSVGSDMDLQAFENATYTLKTAQGEQIKVEVKTVPADQEITGPWEVRFPEGWGAPTSKVFPRLISWTQDSDEGVKYFSGIATYHKEFDLSAGQLQADREVYLDLGRVRFVADVRLNGKHLGILWKPPFRVDITEAARTGQNELVIEVANTWSNRLVGDAHSPEDQRFCRTNITKALTWQSPWKDTPLLESGLLGPVQLVTAKKVNVKSPE
jgi:hypothetical protein